MSAGNNVVEDAKKNFPALTANGHRLEVAIIERVISKVTDANFDKMTTDTDVYAALNSMTTYDLRLAFKACAETLNTECNEEHLNHWNKNRILSLFFHVFDVYPNPHLTGAVAINFSTVANFLPEQYLGVNSVEELKKTLRILTFPTR